MKKLLILLGVLVALLLVGYFVVTSSGFLKAVVLPRIGSALHARVEAGTINLSPFSSIEIRDLTVTPEGAERLATVEHARVRYSLFAILGGRIALDEVVVTAPVLTVIQKPDGTSNLDPILKGRGGQGGSSASSPPKPGTPPQLDLKSLRIERASLTYQSSTPDGATTRAEITGLNLAARDLRNGGRGAADLDGRLTFRQAGPGQGTATNAADATLKGNFEVDLSPDLSPAAVAGKAEAQLTAASGTFRDFQGFSAALNADLAPTELKALVLAFSRQGTAFGSISAKGPLDLAKKEGKLDLRVNAIDRNVLNLFGAAMGLDFTTTRFDSSNVVEFAAGGSRVGIAGSATGTQVSVKKGDLVLPPLQLRNAYDVSVDLNGQLANVRAFDLNASQSGREIVRGTLSQPMQISWAPNAPALPDAAIDVVVSDLRLADWSALMGAPFTGVVQGKAKVGVQGGGKDLGVKATTSITGVSGVLGTNQVKNLGLNAVMDAVVGSFAETSKRRLKLDASVKDLAGEVAAVKFEHHGLEAKLDLGLPEGVVAIHAAELRLREGTREGGALTVKGQWDLQHGSGDIGIVAKDVNESGLRPFLQAALGDKQLRSIQLAADVGVKLNPAADSSVKATATVTNLVVRDPSGTVPESPLAVGLALDASGKGGNLALRQAELRLTPTARGKNVVTLSGDLDTSKANALRGALKLAAESLDITPYYELFAGAAKPAEPEGAPKPGPGSPQKEPEAITLPVDSLTLDARVGKFFLREVAAENVVALVKVNGSRIEVEPFKLALNGAPIEATLKLNVGVPGYEYDFKFSADAVPVKPFANSFVPMLKNRVEGAINAGAQVRGAGVTGTSLQKHLQGGLNFTVTNANLRLTPAGNQKSGFLTILTGLLATALNIRELKDQPIMDISAEAKMGEGRIDLTKFAARSQSLAVGSQGSIPIAADLMQSPLKLPLQVALSRPLAEKAKLMSADTPTNAVYVPLPGIASVKGTLGAPTPEVDKVQTALLAARGISGLIGGQAGGTLGAAADLVSGVSKGGTNAVGTLLKGLGGLLGPKPGASPPATATNAPAPSPAKVAPNPAAPPKKKP